jgi:hypothetical protein
LTKCGQRQSTGISDFLTMRRKSWNMTLTSLLECLVNCRRGEALLRPGFIAGWSETL